MFKVLLIIAGILVAVCFGLAFVCLVLATRDYEFPDLEDVEIDEITP